MNNQFPAGYSGMITAGSFNSQNQISDFSNKASDIYLPGECLQSSNKDFIKGNSYSAPILSASILMIKMFRESGSGTTYYKGLIKANSDDKNGLLILNIPKLIKISEENDEYKKNLEGIKKDLSKTDSFLDKFKESINNDSSLDGYEKALNKFKSEFNKTQNDLNSKLLKFKSAFKDNGIELNDDNLIIKEVNKDLTAVGEFLNGDKLVLEITQEKKLRQTLGVDSCIENKTKIKCGSEKNAISDKCMNKFAGGKNLVCGVLVPIISSGTQLPAEGSGTYVTILNNQENLPISIVQGENFISKDDTPIGKLILEKLPKKSAGQAGGNVNFMIDSSGTLSVKVVDINNNSNEVKSRIENLLSTDNSSQKIGEVPKNTEKIEELQNIIKTSLVKFG